MQTSDNQRQDWIDLVRFLVQSGADPNVVDDKDETVLHRAADKGFFDIVRYLIQNGADVNLKDNSGLTPLHLAAGSGKLDIVKFMLEEGGARASARDNAGRTVLHRKKDITEN